MTVSRTAEALDADDAPPPMVPLLPYAYMAYAQHCSRDYADYVDRLTHADAPLAAEEALGLDMISGMNRAFFTLFWGPIDAAMSQARL
jgi:hypothetical protein